MQSLEQKLHNFLQDAVQEDTAPCWGAAVVTKQAISEVVVAGDGDPNEHVPLDKEAIYWYASGSKLLIALAILRAIEQGLVKGMPWQTAFDDTDALVRYLPELKVGGDHWFMHIIEGWIGDVADRKPKLRKATKPVSLRHLLTWSCGARGQLFDLNMALLRRPGREGDEPVLHDVMTGHISTLCEPRYSEADESFGYGSAANDFLGVFLSRACGMPQREAVRKLVVEPLGISPEDMDHYLSPARRKRKLPIHTKTPTGWLAIPLEPAVASWSDGPPQDHHEFGNAGIYGTIGAYAIVLQAVLTRSPKLLSASAWEYVVQDDLLRRKSRVVLPDPLWTDEGTPEGTSTVHLEQPNVGVTLLQAIIEREKTPSGLPAGSLSWHGLSNITWFVDQVNGVAGVCGTQTLPFWNESARKTFIGFRKFVEDNLEV